MILEDNILFLNLKKKKTLKNCTMNHGYKMKMKNDFTKNEKKN